MSIGTLFGFGFLWDQYGGVNGSFSYAYLTLLAIYAVILPGVFKIVYSVVLCTLCVVLTSYSYPTADQVDASVVISFIINATITGGTVLYLKWFYDKNRESFYAHNEKLDEK
ncbi:hypothetical protein [Reichenbachiella ulvae]|uniref:Uncharacterized protein n=1 Tax=Reichenbachiella ulvae TaxID=2980104 RepID=A0ABT3D126_9BACT|nr:hypothetical protein [Reichenbachiella ulvae]MCV9389534.1 hypothetical protein [Reichenbachiella ulvae]